MATGSPPTGIVLTDVSVCGSICATVPPRLFVAQIKPPPQAIASGPLPTWIVWITTCLIGSIRETVWASILAVQIEPSHAATALGEAPSGTCPLSVPVLASKIPIALVETGVAFLLRDPRPPVVARMTAALIATTAAAPRPMILRRPRWIRPAVCSGGNVPCESASPVICAGTTLST